MNNNHSISNAIDRFDYSIININHKLDFTPIKKLEFYIKEVDDKGLSIIASTFKKTFSFLIHHHRINIYPDKISMKEDECILSQDEINLLKETLSFLPGKIVKAYICDVLYFFSKNNQFSLMAIECYLSHKSIVENESEESLFFYRMAMLLCNIKGDKFSTYREKIKKDLIKLTKNKQISYLEVYSILSIDKKLERETKVMFAELISDIPIKLIEREISIIHENKKFSPLLLSIQQNVNIYAEHASRIYKEIECSNNIVSLNAKIVKNILFLIESIETLEKRDITEGLKIQLCFLAENYKNNSSKNALSEIGCNSHNIEMMINKVKANAVVKGEMVTMQINDYIEEISKIIERTDSASEALSLFGQYKFKDIHPLDYINDRENSNQSFEELFKKTTISDDGRTISHNQENTQYTILFYSLYGAIFNASLRKIVTKFSNTTETLKILVEKSNILPEKMKPFLFTGLERWLKEDITSAIFILTPQYESFVRDHLKKHSISTITTNKGCQDELSLPNLMKKPEISNIFIREFVFEIEQLLTDSSGTNLRHKVAHGLLTSDDLKNSILDYICWRWLSVVTGSFNPFLIDGK